MSKKGFCLVAIGSVLVVVTILACEWKVEHNRERMTQTTQGIVVSFDPNNHGAITYEYYANDRRYYVVGQSVGSAYKLGSWYPVHYDPSNPGLSILGEIPPPMNIKSLVEVMGTFIGCFVLILLIGRRGTALRR